MDIIVQKFGGATLATPEKIKDLARGVKSLHSQGKSLIVVVSAMGRTTNDLIDLSKQISSFPSRRELDMLLTAGERISMSLMSMALNDLDCPAISFTGSQAGLMTNDTHSNAFITDIRPFRIEEALKQGKVVVTAGFQGVSPVTKEVTTLGRGGSDTSAVALAAHFKASRCEILKEVEGVYSADPGKIKEAKLLSMLSYDQLIDMTYWGAKVLHARAAELAQRKNVPLFIKAAHSPQSEGTCIGDQDMYEFQGVLSVNSFDEVLLLESPSSHMDEALGLLDNFLKAHRIGEPQILKLSQRNPKCLIYLTGPKEVLTSIKDALPQQKSFELSSKCLSSVTATCTGTTSPSLYKSLCNKLLTHGIHPIESHISGMSVTYFIESKDQQICLQALHQIES